MLITYNAFITDKINLPILIKISPKFVPKGQINNSPSLGQIMACRLAGANLGEILIEIHAF